MARGCREVKSPPTCPRTRRIVAIRSAAGPQRERLPMGHPTLTIGKVKMSLRNKIAAPDEQAVRGQSVCR